MTNDDFDEPIELTEDMLSPGTELAPAPPAPDIYRQWSDPMPSRLSPNWVEGQLQKAVWKDTRSAINPQSICFMAGLRAQAMSIKGVMARMGLSPGAWHSWMKRAREGEQPYLLWSQCMGHAQADMEEELLDNVRNAATTDWKASSWLLGKMQPDDYSDKIGTTNNTINVHGDVNTQQTTVNSISNEELQDVMGIMNEINVLKRLEPVDAEIVEEDNA